MSDPCEFFFFLKHLLVQINHACQAPHLTLLIYSVVLCLNPSTREEIRQDTISGDKEFCLF